MMLRVLGLLLLVSGAVAGILLAAASMTRARTCFFHVWFGPNTRPADTDDALILYDTRELSMLKLEGVRHVLSVSIPTQLELVCVQAQLSNASPYPIIAPLIVNYTLERVEAYLLHPSDAATISSLISNPNVPFSYVLELAKRKAVASLNMTEVQGAANWSRLEGYLEAEAGSYVSLIVMTARPLNNPGNCTARYIHSNATMSLCRVVSPTINQFARSALMIILGILLLSYDLRRRP